MLSGLNVEEIEALYLIDSDGKSVVLPFHRQASTLQFDVSGFEAGTYVLMVQFPTNFESLKLVVVSR